MRKKVGMLAVFILWFCVLPASAAGGRECLSSDQLQYIAQWTIHAWSWQEFWIPGTSWWAASGKTVHAKVSYRPDAKGDYNVFVILPEIASNDSYLLKDSSLHWRDGGGSVPGPFEARVLPDPAAYSRRIEEHFPGFFRDPGACVSDLIIRFPVTALTPSDKGFTPYRQWMLQAIKNAVQEEVRQWNEADRPRPGTRATLVIGLFDEWSSWTSVAVPELGWFLNITFFPKPYDMAYPASVSHQNSLSTTRKDLVERVEHNSFRLNIVF